MSDAQNNVTDSEYFFSFSHSNIFILHFPVFSVLSVVQDFQETRK